MHDVDAVLARELNDLLEERQLDTLRGRIGREIDDEHPRLGEGELDRLLELGEEIDIGRQRHVTNIGAGDHRPVDVDRIARVRHQHRVAATERGERQMRNPFLGADGDDRLGFGIELDAPAALVPLADRAPQARNAARHGVAVRVRSLHGFDELVDDVPGRGAIGIAHPEVDDVLPAAAGGHLELRGDIKDVRGEALDARELRPDRGRHARSFCVRKRPEPSERRRRGLKL